MPGNELLFQHCLSTTALWFWKNWLYVHKTADWTALKSPPPEDTGSTDQRGTENGVSDVFSYAHSHPVLPACKTAHWSKGDQKQTPEGGETSERGEEGKPELLDLVHLHRNNIPILSIVHIKLIQNQSITYHLSFTAAKWHDSPSSSR